jgi:hypothetical protein
MTPAPPLWYLRCLLFCLLCPYQTPKKTSRDLLPNTHAHTIRTQQQLLAARSRLPYLERFMQGVLCKKSIPSYIRSWVPLSCDFNCKSVKIQFSKCSGQYRVW